MLVPDSYENVAKRRREILRWAKAQVTLGELKHERYEELKTLVLMCMTTDELTTVFGEALNKFKNGKERLERLERV